MPTNASPNFDRAAYNRHRLIGQKGGDSPPPNLGNYFKNDPENAARYADPAPDAGHAQPSPDQPLNDAASTSTAAMTSDNNYESDYGAGGDGATAQWFKDKGHEAITAGTKALGIPDDGAGSDQVLTYANTAADAAKPAAEFGQHKATPALQHARADRGPDFSKADAMNDEIDKAQEDAINPSFGSQIARFFLPPSMSQDRNARLQSLLNRQEIEKERAVRNHQRANPELYQAPSKVHALTPGTILMDEQGVERGGNARPDMAASAAKAPNFQRVTDEAGNVSGYNPQDNTLVPSMTPVPDTQGPNPDGSAGYVGQKQANLGAKPPARETPEDAAIRAGMVEAAKQAAKPPASPRSLVAGRPTVSVDDKNARRDLEAARTAFGKLTPRQQKDPQAAKDLEARYNLDAGTLSGGKPIAGVTSNGSKYQIIK